MSVMNATHSAATPACAYSARSASMCFSPAWCVTTGRRSAGSRASARGTHSFSATAPKLPPTTSSRSGPVRPAKRCSGGATATMSARSGLPTHSTRGSRPSPRTPGKPVSTRSAPKRSTRLASPAFASRLCTTSGTLRATAISAPGNDAKPPKPMTTAGRRRPSTRNACTHAARIAYGPSSRRTGPLPRTLRNAIPSKSMPCWGTRRASMPSRVPSQKTFQPRRVSSAATAMPGKMWPPVPPVVIIAVAVTRCNPATCAGSRSRPAAGWRPRRSWRRCRCRRTTAAAASGPWSAARPC